MDEMILSLSEERATAGSFLTQWLADYNVNDEDGADIYMRPTDLELCEDEVTAFDGCADDCLTELSPEEGLPVYVTAPCRQPENANTRRTHRYVATLASLLRGLRFRRLQTHWSERSEDLSRAFLARRQTFQDLDDAIVGEGLVSAFLQRPRSFGNISERSTEIMSQGDDDDAGASHLPSHSSSWASLFSDSSHVSTLGESSQIMTVTSFEENKDGLDLSSDRVEGFVLQSPIGPNTNRPKGQFGRLR